MNSEVNNPSPEAGAFKTNRSEGLELPKSLDLRKTYSEIESSIAREEQAFRLVEILFNQLHADRARLESESKLVGLEPAQLLELAQTKINQLRRQLEETREMKMKMKKVLDQIQVMGQALESHKTLAESSLPPEVRSMIERQRKFGIPSSELDRVLDPGQSELKDVVRAELYVPRKIDIERFVAIAQAGQAVERRENEPLRILDLGGGKGFLDKLLADYLRESGLTSSVVDLDIDTETLKRARKVYADTPNLHFIGSDTSKEARNIFRNKFDMVIASWVHPDQTSASGFQKTIEDLEPAYAVVVGEHRGEATQRIIESEKYKKIAEWIGPRSLEISTGVSEKEDEDSGDLYGTNLFEVYARNDLGQANLISLTKRLISSNKEITPEYVWEAELAELYEKSPVTVDREEFLER